MPLMPTLRFATESDNTQLAALASAIGMNGETALRIDRSPDFFGLLRMRGESKVVVAVEDRRIVGSVSVSRQDAYIGGKVYPVYYVADFKVVPELRRKGIGLMLCDELARYVLSQNGDLVFLTVAWGNNKPLGFFKNREGVPDFENIGRFTVYQFIGKKTTTKQFPVEKAVVNEELVNYFDNHYKRYELGAVVTHDKLSGNEVYVIRRNDIIIAAMCIADTMKVKQNVVVRMRWHTKTMLAVLNTFRDLISISPMPVINKPVMMMYIKYLAVIHNDPSLVRALVDFARNVAYEKKYSFVSIGVHERDLLNESLPTAMRLKFYSKGMLLTVKNSQELIWQVKDGVPFEDYSLV
jgi:ribosomal protein S18 acetylase RimI-like enzyme